MRWWEMLGDVNTSEVQSLLYKYIDEVESYKKILLQYIVSKLSTFEGSLNDRANEYILFNLHEDSFMSSAARLLIVKGSADIHKERDPEILYMMADTLFGHDANFELDRIFISELLTLIDRSYITGGLAKFIIQLVSNYKTSYPDEFKLMIAITCGTDTLCDLEKHYRVESVEYVSSNPIVIKCITKDLGVDFDAGADIEEMGHAVYEELMRFKESLPPGYDELSFEDLKTMYIYKRMTGASV